MTKQELVAKLGRLQDTRGQFIKVFNMVLDHPEMAKGIRAMGQAANKIVVAFRKKVEEKADDMVAIIHKNIEEALTESELTFLVEFYEKGGSGILQKLNDTLQKAQEFGGEWGTKLMGEILSDLDRNYSDAIDLVSQPA